MITAVVSGPYSVPTLPQRYLSTTIPEQQGCVMKIDILFPTNSTNK